MSYEAEQEIGFLISIWTKINIDILLYMYDIVFIFNSPYGLKKYRCFKVVFCR